MSSEEQDKFEIFYDAVCNEISIDTEILDRIQRTDLDYVPVRVLKSGKYIDKLGVNKRIYSFFVAFFMITSPVFFSYKMLRAILSKRSLTVREIPLNKNFALVANTRFVPIFNKLNVDTDVVILNINQSRQRGQINVIDLLNLADFFKAYVYSLLSLVYLFKKLETKSNMLQAYVAYDWFLIYSALLKIKERPNTVYFSNHYDRWAVLFDQIFCTKKTVLLQHGLLPDWLELHYKMPNVDVIYTLDHKSVDAFNKIFGSTPVNFKLLDSSLDLVDLNSDNFSILIIGQPHAASKEIEIINILNGSPNLYDIYLKPHPLFDNSIYNGIKNINIIKKTNFFPRVDLALNYESTLGSEYERSGVEVLWWKGMEIGKISSFVEARCNSLA